MLVSGLGVWFIGTRTRSWSAPAASSSATWACCSPAAFVERSWWNLAVAAFIGLLYWYQLYNILPTDQPISWQGHLLGLLAAA